ncbi:MAG: SDR family oxidoreductase [Rhodospirillaceae bacterium]|jgi:NAD(P)-dependent dehydrogenase (short-subunit alcohol dehydrogenase family)|nr:SDR family oxidoreductase [Rhodospirillaceae bacterium]MBT6830247.1 SDR family oxidoreductase [Rhodospirillaceae bacterium]
MRLKGKKAIITGAATGIGLETARRFAEEGAQVVLSDIDSAGVAAAAGEITGAIAIAADVTDQGQVDALIAGAIEGLGGLDIFVNNAGIPMLGGVESLAEADWDREMDVNLKSIYRTGRAVWPHFKAQGGGVILNTASIAGLRGSAGQASYGAAKAGVINLTRCMAIDGAQVPIRVNCICPGFIETPMVLAYLEGQDDPVASRAEVDALHPLGGIGRPGDIAAGFVYLASDEASWITGTALTIDGGLTAGI